MQAVRRDLHTGMESELFNLLFPVMFVLALGYSSAKLYPGALAGIESLNILATNYVYPAALILGIAQTPREVLLSDSRMALSLMIGFVTMFWGVLIVARYFLRYALEEATVFGFASSQGAFTSVGMGVLHGLYGPQSIVAVAISVIVGNVLTMPVFIFIMESKTATAGSTFQRFLTVFGRTLQSPIVSVPIIGVLLVILDLNLPVVLQKSASLIGIGASGIGLYMAGLNIGRFPLRVGRAGLMIAFLKLMVAPAIVWVSCMALTMLKTHLNEVVLISAMPIGALASVLASRYSVNEEVTAQSVVASFVMCLVTIPAWFYILSKW